MMKRQHVARLFLGISLLALLGLSCSLVSQVGGGIRSTAQAGQELIQTGQAMVTEVQVGGLAETAQAIATQVDEAGVKETFQAAATQIDESGLQETAQAALTQVVISPEQIPPDIPIFPGENGGFVGSPQAITYFVPAEIKAVLEFYQTQMPQNGWTKVDYGTTVTDLSAELHFEKDGRKATILITTLPFVNQTNIVISLQ